MTRKRPDKYDISGNTEAQYMDKDDLVLVNKMGIVSLETLQIAEEEGSGESIRDAAL